VNVFNFAIRIDPVSISAARQGPAVEDWINIIKERYMGKQLVIIQVAVSTIELAELHSTVSDIVIRINPMYASLAHQPLVSFKQDISHPQSMALLTVADSLIVTSLREGMNLTSREFILCQDGKNLEKKHGPLILNESTGSASVLGGHELSVNPWDYKQCSDAIKEVLVMKPKEKQARWLELYKA
jgi:trehalose 6-phosphate synthase/phosphatase